MTNMYCLIGRIGEIKDNGIVIKVGRCFKNAEGIYETDDIFVECFEYVISKVKDYCKVGDLVGTKGRIQADNGNIRIICEKLTFLSSNQEILKKEGANEEYN